MEDRILLREGVKKHKGTLIGIGCLLFLVSLTLCSVLTVSLRSSEYVHSELKRIGYGTLTAWVSKVPNLEHLAETVGKLDEIESVETQRLIYAEYEVNDTESDSEGQLLLWEAGENVYRFLEDGLSGYTREPENIAEGTVYVSPSMQSVMDLGIGDEITFRIARNSENLVLTVAGYYEDPVMGSSMIGMKGFLISEEDYAKVLQIVQETGADSLAREGAMLHIQTTDDSNVTASQLGQAVSDNTPISEYMEFMYSADTIEGFMTILENAFAGLFIVFAVVLFAVTMVILGHSISGMVEQEYGNLGILKTIGLTGRHLIWLQFLQYALAILIGLLLAVPVGWQLTKVISTMTVTTTGFLIPSRIPAGAVTISFAVVLMALAAYTLGSLWRILSISPVGAIRRDEKSYSGKSQIRRRPIKAKNLSFSLAIRQLQTGKKRYLSACLTALMLVFFASMAGRMNAWLGPDGKGMMDAFNPADLDIGVQVLGELDQEEVEHTIRSYTEITNSYLLAMPSVSINGTNYTANVITEPERFHISRGRTCRQDNEVVLTEVAAKDLGVDTGDTVTIRGETGTGEFVVSGIYHCANDMGANLGMSREGYLTIGQDHDNLWCYHYFLEDTSRQTEITEVLENTYGGDVHVHENSWPGLYGILSAMHMLLVFMYVMSCMFILIVTILTGSKILTAEQKDLGIYKSLGFSSGQLRFTFALRFTVTAAIGAVVGIILAIFLADPVIAAVMRVAGISNFSSGPTVGSVLLPGVFVIFLFTVTAWLEAGHIRRTDLSVLAIEES